MPDPTDEQQVVIDHRGPHARLLAGPGTGKTLTLTKRAVSLVEDDGIAPERILAITFTRAAAYELRQRLREQIEDDRGIPRVTTLHSFALRQLLLNAETIDRLPTPLRIANDWEERNIVYEDLKRRLDYDIETVKERFNEDLSSDWESLAADRDDWEENFPDAQFLGAWREHRTLYGYTLRSELVYQLKKSLEQESAFSLESDFSHALVDEFQDLNACDISIIEELQDQGVKVFGAGDDDQSIYGFRNADPAGIRDFPERFAPCTSLELETCMRCAERIVGLAEFIADLDPDREPKTLVPRDGAPEGEVHLVRFPHQDEEAAGVAQTCRHLITERGYEPGEILVLVRSDKNQAFSRLIKDVLLGQDVPVTIGAGQDPLQTESGQLLLSYLQLLERPADSLALRSLLAIPATNVGPATIDEIHEYCRGNDERFAQGVRDIVNDSGLISRGDTVRNAVSEIDDTIDEYQTVFDGLDEDSDPNDLLQAIEALAEDVIDGDSSREEILDYTEEIVDKTEVATLQELLTAVTASLGAKEQQMADDEVNIMTMHQAKGLTAEAVIIVAAEDEYIPGDPSRSDVDDERRLLYVSLTRAKRFLLITYCHGRNNQQMYFGSTSGEFPRTLTRFLRDSPLTPMSGNQYLSQL